MKIRNEILNILDKCTVDGNTVLLTCGQLDRKTYDEVNKCLESIGGRWNRKSKGHVFDSDPTELLDNLILTGETVDLKKQYQYFPTPKEMVKVIIELAEINNTHIVLEPSAGQGAIADEINRPERILCCELNPQYVSKLIENGYSVYAGDFLEMGNSNLFDRIVMNPPFSRQQDIDHVLHAWELLNTDGILVSVVSESPFFRENKKSVAFREWLNINNAEIIENDVGAFKESGTMVKTRIIKVRK